MKPRERGLTLIEVIVAVAIMGLVVAAVLGAYSVASRGVSEATRIEEAQKGARDGLNRLSNEMRGAVGGQINAVPDPDGPLMTYLGAGLQFTLEMPRLGPMVYITVWYYVRSGTIRTGEKTPDFGWPYGTGVLPDRMLVRQELHPATLNWTDRVRNPADAAEQPADPTAPWEVIATGVHRFDQGDYAQPSDSGLRITPGTSGAKEYILSLTIRVPGSQCVVHWDDPTLPRTDAVCLWIPRGKRCMELNRSSITQVSIRN